MIFSHPCFPNGRAHSDGDSVEYRWDFPYFDRQRCSDPPWGHFTSDFIWFHRPLSDYWKAFKAAGFDVLELEEPRISEERQHLAPSGGALRSNRSRPYSIAFKLRTAPGNLSGARRRAVP